MVIVLEKERKRVTQRREREKERKREKEKKGEKERTLSLDPPPHPPLKKNLVNVYDTFKYCTHYFLNNNNNNIHYINHGIHEAMLRIDMMKMECFLF